MKIVVATKQTQGKRDNDFSFVREGEIVYPSWTCTSGSADDHCGCRRCLTGVKHGKGTTTVKVVESPLSRAQYEHAIMLGIKGISQGHKTPPEESMLADAMAIVDEFTRAVARRKVGDVLEYRDGKFGLREPAR